MRKIPLVVGELYHVFTRSIADFKVFNNDTDFFRIQQLIKYYKCSNDLKYSKFIELEIYQKNGFHNAFELISKDKEKLVQMIAYCIMPTHLHIILKQLVENGISNYTNTILNSYSRFFNANHKRKGPLWESRFKSVLVDSDSQLLHLTRYLHLNPVTAGLVEHPEDWDFSSYKEYLEKTEESLALCQYEDLMEIKPPSYRKFVNDRISYQRELAKIKNLIMD